jgi:outer membrane protein assembly factor BamB
MRTVVAAFAATLLASILGWPAVRSETATPSAALAYETVSFDDLAPAGFVLKQCWNALGMDGQERVYIGFTGMRPEGREDFAVFRYDPATRERRFLGTFIDASQQAGNLQPGEQIPKGHTRPVEIDGRIFMGSQGFHDLKQAIDALPGYRGAHLYAYDIARDALEDISRFLPGGVVVEHQGIVALSPTPLRGLLVGLTHPHSDIVLFDPRASKVERIVPGIPWSLGNPLSREVIATPAGRIYTYRGTEELAAREAVHPIWAYDLATDRMVRTPYTATGGFWDGQTWTRDGRTVYVSTVNGELYRLDVDTETFTHLGHFLPQAELDAGVRVNWFYGITLSADERRIYGIPQTNRSARSNLYAYDIATGTVALAGELEPAIHTGSHMRDSRGNLYFARFGDGREWEGRARLLVVRDPAWHEVPKEQDTASPSP